MGLRSYGVLFGCRLHDRFLVYLQRIDIVEKNGHPLHSVGRAALDALDMLYVGSLMREARSYIPGMRYS